jgi:hypothetical protein
MAYKAYKKISEKLKEHFQNASKEELDKEWEELKEWNEIGPSVEEYIQTIRNLN